MVNVVLPGATERKVRPRYETGSAHILHNLRVSLQASICWSTRPAFLPKPFLEQTWRNGTEPHRVEPRILFRPADGSKGMAALNGGSIVNIGSMWRRGGRGNALFGLFDGEAGIGRPDAAPRDGVGSCEDPSQRCPSRTDRDTYFESFIPKYQVHRALQGFNGFHPIGRIGTPDDVAEVVCFLLSDKASWGRAQFRTSTAA